MMDLDKADEFLKCYEAEKARSINSYTLKKLYHELLESKHQFCEICFSLEQAFNDMRKVCIEECNEESQKARQNTWKSEKDDLNKIDDSVASPEVLEMVNKLKLMKQLCEKQSKEKQKMAKTLDKMNDIVIEKTEQLCQVIIDRMVVGEIEYEAIVSVIKLLLQEFKKLDIVFKVIDIAEVRNKFDKDMQRAEKLKGTDKIMVKYENDLELFTWMNENWTGLIREIYERIEIVRKCDYKM